VYFTVYFCSFFSETARLFLRKKITDTDAQYKS